MDNETLRVMMNTMLVISIIFTLAHAYEEWLGQSWIYLGEVTGATWARRLSDPAGLMLFIVPPVLLQLTLAAMAYLGVGSVSAIIALVGCRITDVAVNHALLTVRGYRPNPGGQTAWLYASESIAIVVLFADRFGSCNAGWLVLGLLCFSLIQPVMGLTGNE